MCRSFLPLWFFLLLLPSAWAQLPGTKSDWKGFTRFDFPVDGNKSWVVAPKNTAEGKPWVWRARFFGHEPQADIALLNEGFHLAYCDVGNLFGSPKAVERWNVFYKLLTEKHGFSKKVALEGMSRGGLIIYNWAAANPEKVACLYGDAPVCDFKSWPGGKGKGKGGGGAWQQCLDAYGFSEEEALAYKGNPIDQLAPLAKAEVPILHVVGDADIVVPVDENSKIIEERYRELGGSIQVIGKPGVGHHPHALEDPGPIVSFILKHTRPNVRFRGSLKNSQLRFHQEKKGHVAFMGGSITEMDGYRPMVCQSLEKRFPDTEFTFTDAGISSTCSTTGAFRLADHVLSKGPVDLFFIEFAVNDDQDAGHARQECVRGMEGIIRHAREHNPKADIVVTYFVNPGMLKQLQAGKTPVSMEAHGAVARHYGVSTIHLAKEVAERISSEKISWKDFGGTHPKPLGNRICADMIDRLLDEAWAEVPSGDAVAKTHPVPGSPLDSLHYGNGRFVGIKSAAVKSGWEARVPDWKSLAGGKRSRFTSLPMLCATESGAELELEFSGTAVGVYIVAGPDAGIVEVKVDDGDFEKIDLFHRYSKGLHYPRTVMLATDLSDGMHTLTLRVSSETRSAGHAVRIMEFVAN